MEVDQAVFDERSKVYDERFARDKHDIQSLKIHQEDADDRAAAIEKLQIQMAEIIKNHESQIKDHEVRVTALEHKGGKKWDKVIDCIISGVVAAGVAAFMTLIL